MSSDTQQGKIQWPKLASATGVRTRFNIPHRTRVTGLILLACLGINLAQATGSLYVARNFPEHFIHGQQRVTLLPDGTIFKYSDCEALADKCADELLTTGNFAEVSLWNPGTQQWDTESVADYRNDFTSTLTRDGRIVMVGGWIPFNEHPIPTTSIYDSQTQTFRTGPTLNEPRHRHTATELSDGSVLVVGGETAPETTTAGVELITAGGWRKTMRAMLQDRSNHTATRLSSGNILVVGGTRYVPLEAWQNPNRLLHPKLAILDTVELYDVANDRWSAMPPLPAPRTSHSATLLPDGRVLIVGGWSGDYRNPLAVAASVLLWDPTTHQWSATHDLPRGREGHVATLLPSGNVLISGGLDERNAPIHDLVLWDHMTGQWSDAGRAHDRMQLLDHTTALLPNGNVLLLPTFGQEMAAWSPQPARDPSGNWVSPRGRPTITRLTDGRFLMVGGEIEGYPLFDAHIYDPATQRWSDTGQMHYPRKDHHATRLVDGRVLVFGGNTAQSLHDPYDLQEKVPAEIWDSGTGEWQLFPALATQNCPKYSNGITLPPDPGRICWDDWSQLRSLADGRVLFGTELSTDANTPKEYRYRTWIPGDLPPAPPERIESPRPGGRLTLLDDGSLVYVGGRDSSGQLSAQLDIFEFDSKRWRPAGKLQHPLDSPDILDLGDQRLLVFEHSDAGPVSTAELWDRASGSTQAISPPSDFMVSDTPALRQDPTEPQWLRSQAASQQPVRSNAWHAIGLSPSKILLITEERSYLSASPYERWETIHNEVKLRRFHLPIASLQNGNVLAFTATPLPLGLWFCEPCLDAAYHGQYLVAEFDSGKKQWHSIYAVANQDPTSPENAGLTEWPANLTRSDGPFHFLVAPHPDIKLKVRASYRHELFMAVGLLMCLSVALIYRKKRPADDRRLNRP